MHTPRLSTNGINHTCLCLPSRSWYSFTNPGGMKGWVGLGWLVGYIPKLHTKIDVRHRELNPDTVAHLSTNRARRRLTSSIEANALTTTPDHQPCTCRYALRLFVTKTKYSKEPDKQTVRQTERRTLPRIQYKIIQVVFSIFVRIVPVYLYYYTVSQKTSPTFLAITRESIDGFL